MPYKARGRWVYVEKGGQWVPFKRHDTAAQAERHAAALNIHVTAKEGKGGKK